MTAPRAAAGRERPVAPAHLEIPRFVHPGRPFLNPDRVLLSLGAETAQYFLVSRYSELGDVVLNGIGTLIGLLLALAISRRPAPP